MKLRSANSILSWKKSASPLVASNFHTFEALRIPQSLLRSTLQILTQWSPQSVLDLVFFLLSLLDILFDT